MRTCACFLIFVLAFQCRTGRPVSDKTFEYEVRIPTNLSFGYLWELADTSEVKIVEHTSVPNSNQEEFTDIEIIKIKTQKKGPVKLVFYKKRPFEPWSDTSKLKKTIRVVGE